MKKLKTSEIPIRDPFVVPVSEQGLYYLYGSTDADIWSGKGCGFDVYRSNNLRDWQGPFPVFRPWPGFWADKNYWAPEVHLYKGRYYMLASFYADGYCRGTQIMAADTPMGPFEKHSDGPVTPKDWDCLDGTLLIEDGKPWIVFCREWTMIGDGQICAMRLNDDLSESIGEPQTLFSASDAAWARQLKVEVDNVPFKIAHVTDGPFMYRTDNDNLLMLWSSFTHYGKAEYALGAAYSESGKIVGPWKHGSEPLFSNDGGHGMLFTRFDGQLMLILHSPNKPVGCERARFIPVFK